MEQEKICTESGCGGKIKPIDKNNLGTEGKNAREVYPCDKCRRLHSDDGKVVESRNGKKPFLSQEGKIILVKK